MLEGTEAQIKIIKSLLDENLATKYDIELVKHEIVLVRRDMKALELSLLSKIKGMETRLLAILIPTLLGSMEYFLS